MVVDMKRIMLGLLLGGCLILAGCGSKQEQLSTEQVMEKTQNEKVEAANTEDTEDSEVVDNFEYAAVVHVKINPDLNLYMDSDKNIVYVECLNQDASDLCAKLKLEGESLESAMNTIVNAAIEEGYLTAENKVEAEVTYTDDSISSESIEQELEPILASSEEKKLDLSDTSEGKTICTDCNGTGICPECGGGTYPCKRCNGTLYETCGTCNGTGIQTCQGCNGSGVDATDGSACRHCGGAGTVTCGQCNGAKGKACSICNGKGVISDDCILCHGAKYCVTCGGTGTL